MKKQTNPCPRCGNERIIVRTWKEKIWDSVVINTETKCSNKECQKEVDKDNKKTKERNEQNRLRIKNRVRNAHPKSQIEKISVTS